MKLEKDSYLYNKIIQWRYLNDKGSNIIPNYVIDIDSNGFILVEDTNGNGIEYRNKDDGLHISRIFEPSKKSEEKKLLNECLTNMLERLSRLPYPYNDLEIHIILINTLHNLIKKLD
jgi:hypothetical protein